MFSITSHVHALVLRVASLFIVIKDASCSKKHQIISSPNNVQPPSPPKKAPLFWPCVDENRFNMYLIAPAGVFVIFMPNLVKLRFVLLKPISNIGSYIVTWVGR